MEAATGQRLAPLLALGFVAGALARDGAHRAPSEIYIRTGGYLNRSVSGIGLDIGIEANTRGDTITLLDNGVKRVEQGEQLIEFGPNQLDVIAEAALVGERTLKAEALESSHHRGGANGLARFSGRHAHHARQEEQTHNGKAHNLFTQT